jgi:cbb3-type cytochrome oxidase subunit 3
MFKKYFEGINGIEVYPVFLLIVFVTFFIAMSVWLIRANKTTMEVMSKIPFNNEDESIQKS